MKAHVALLRGINVGKHKRIAMSDLKALIEGLGHEHVLTYVNSGNVVFGTARDVSSNVLAAEIEAAIKARQGLDVGVVVRSGADMAQIVRDNPFPQLTATPKQLHVSFLAQPLTPEQISLVEALDTGSDEVRIFGLNVYLSLPNLMSGANPALIGFDRTLKVLATSRNWNTVTKLAAMTAEIEAETHSS